MENNKEIVEALVMQQEVIKSQQEQLKLLSEMIDLVYMQVRSLQSEISSNKN